METRPAPWIAALRSSHDRLASLVEPLDAAELERPSYDDGWTIAQVLSHLGSQAEIFGKVLDAVLRGEEPPGRESFPPIWDVWNAKSPSDQAADALRLDGEMQARLEALDGDEAERFRVELFGANRDLAAFARMRLGEHALHTWDVAVAFDPAAEVSPDAVELLVDTVDQLAARTGRPPGRPIRVRILTSEPDRSFLLDVGEAVSLAPTEAKADGAQVRLLAAALVRLVYGRLDASHTPSAESDGVDLDELRRIFPGF